MSGKNIFNIGLITYSFLLLCAVVYFKERTVILDSAYHLFHIVYYHDFAIQGHRFGAALTQVYPLMAVKMNWSLDAIAIAYSLSFVIFFTLAFLLTLFWTKNTRMALCILLFNVLMVTHTFYWPHPELPAGVVFTLFYFAWLDRFLQGDIKSKSFWIAVPLFLVTIALFHPLLLFVFFFVSAYLFLQYKTGTKFLVLSASGYLLILMLKALLFHSSYESGAMGGLKNIVTLFPHYFDTVSNKNLLQYFLHDYYFVPVLLFGVVLFYIRNKEWYKLLLVVGFFFGFCFIVNLNYVKGTSQFYLEAQYLLLSLFVIFPFVYEVLPSVKKPQLSFVIVFLIAGVGIFRIYNAHEIYSARLDWYRTFLVKTSKLEQKKLILAPDDVPMQTVMMTWGSSYEFWLLSMLEQKESRSVIIEEQKGEYDWRKGDNKALITKWAQFEYKRMDKRYFAFNDTTFYVHLKRQ